MYTLEITASAERDLDEITDYVGNTLFNPTAALRYTTTADSYWDIAARMERRKLDCLWWILL